MRILRVPTDYRVVEQFGTGLLKKSGDYRVYNITKRGMTTGEVLQAMASAAGVDPKEVRFTGQKAREGVAGQVASILGGEEIRLNEHELAIRQIGRLDRHLETDDVTSNAFEVVVRDMTGDDMRRLRHNLAQVKKDGLPAYYDDQRFGCLRHGQGFIVRDILKGHLDTAIRSMIAAPSPYGPDHVEKYKYGIRKRWGDWGELAKYSKGRRGQSLFAYLADNPGDFEGAMRVGFSTSERTIHLFAYQSHLWNRALSLWMRRLVVGEDLGWLPCDEGSLPVFRKLGVEAKAELRNAVLPLPGEGAQLDEHAQRLYQAVFEAEGIRYEKFLNLDLPGFRPVSEDRPVLVFPDYLRAAPAEEDEIYPRGRKMRVRFTVNRGQYSTLVLKRLLMPTNLDAKRLCLWVSRHPLVWPDDNGTPQEFERKSKRDHEENMERRRREKERRGPRRDFDDRDDRRDDRRGPRRDYRDRDDRRGPRRDDRRGGYGQRRDGGDNRGGYGQRRDRDDNRGGYGQRRDRDDNRGPYGQRRDGDDNRSGGHGRGPRRDRDEGNSSPWSGKKWGGKSSKYGRGQNKPDPKPDRRPERDSERREETEGNSKDQAEKKSFFKEEGDKD